MVERVQVAKGYAPQEGDEVFVFWHDHKPTNGRACLAMRGMLLRFTALERASGEHRKASLEIRIAERAPIQSLLVENLQEGSAIAAERILCRKVKKERNSRIAPLEDPETDYLHRSFHDLTSNSEIQAEEGSLVDRTVAFRERNRDIIAERRTRDDHTCQACSFRLELHGRYIIDCHHKYPLAGEACLRITRLDDLMCLCPTCHRIAHTRRSL
jgi:hypothetical protein